MEGSDFTSDVDGWITIGTKIDSTQLDNDYKKLKRDLQNKQKESEELLQVKAKAEFKLKEYEKQKDLIMASTDETLKQAQTQEQVDNVLQMEQIELEELNSQYAEQFDKIKSIDKQIQNNANSQENLKQQIQQINLELNKTRSLSDIKKSINDVGKSIKRVTKQVIHWGLAIFGIRSAYLFVRQAMSTLSGYNEQLATDLQYIRFALASTLEPLIKKIVEWAYKLLQIIGTIVMTLTGYNIFKNSGIDKFQKSLDKSAGSAKEIRKQLAGFDEMNILNDSSSGGGASGGNIAPSIDLSGIQKQKLPQWMLDLLDYGDQIIAILAGITAGLIALNLGLSPLMSLGIGLMVIGIVYAIESLLAYLKDPTWENFGHTIQGIGIALVGLGLTIGSLPLMIAGVAVAIVGIIIEHWEEIRKLFDKAVAWLTKKMEEVTIKYGYFAGLIVEGIRDNVKLIRDFLDNIFKFLKDILDNIIGFFKNVFTGNWKGAWQNLVNIVKDVFGIITTVISTAFGVIKNNIKSMIGVIGDIISGIIKGAINAVFATIEGRINSAIGLFNSVLSVVNKLPGVNINKIKTISLPRLAKGGIINYPGPGVPVGGAIAGERGMEGVVPLTDTQQMALLGEAIGKYITINATVINSMNGRVLSREIQRVQNENNFALNR